MTSPLGEKDALVREAFDHWWRTRLIGSNDPAQSTDYRAIFAAGYKAALTPAAPEGEGRYTIDHDGFTGTVVGSYRRLDGYEGVVMQQDGTKIVHVYGKRHLKPAHPRSIDREALVRLSASEHACYRWPEDTAEQNYRDGLGPDGEK